MNECIICLEDENGSKHQAVLHRSIFNNDCRCNYFIHHTCLVEWIEKNRPQPARCLMCYTLFDNATDITGIERRHTTEYHPRALHAMRQQLLNSDTLQNNHVRINIDQILLRPIPENGVVNHSSINNNQVQNDEQPIEQPNIRAAERYINDNQRQRMGIVHRLTLLLTCFIFVFWFIIPTWFVN